MQFYESAIAELPADAQSYEALIAEVTQLHQDLMSQLESMSGYLYTILSILAFAMILGACIFVVYLMLKPILILWKGGKL